MAHDEVNQQAGAIVRPNNFMIFGGDLLTFKASAIPFERSR
jgi:hypothetical protein